MTFGFLENQKEGALARFRRRLDDWEAFGPGTSGQVVAYDSNLVPVPTSLDNSHLANRTRRISFPLGAGVLIAGTGAFSSSNGLRVSFPDAETGERDWGVILPADVVTAGATLQWLWETPATTGNARFRLTMGQAGASEDSSFGNLLDNTTQYAVQGVANRQGQSSVALSSNLTAGQENLVLIFIREGAHASDTVGDVIYLRAIWLEYTADS
jgi:hypothetical protein